MRRAINIALLVLACALSAHAAEGGITLDVRISPVVAGEILTLHLHGMGRITQEQLQTLSFRVGERRVEGDGVSGDDVYLQTPGDLGNGAHAVKVIRHDPASDRDITLFEKVVEFAANEQRTLGRATVDVGVAGSTMRIDDIAEIELGENVRRTSTRVTVVASTSTLRQRYLVHDQVSRHLPAIAASLQFEVETTGELPGGFALRLKVPKDYVRVIRGQ